MEYFNYSEFDSPDAPGSGEQKMDEQFLRMLDNCRANAGIPFSITSGYRTVAHNTTVGGVPNSSHVHGYAADIACNSSYERGLIISSAVFAGFTRIGIAKTFIHVDNDPNKGPAMWVY